PGWHHMPSMWRCMTNRSGGRKAYQGRRAVLGGRWEKSTMPQFLVAPLRYLASSAFLLLCAEASLKKYCVSIVALNSAVCLAPRLPHHGQSLLKTGRLTSGQQPTLIRTERVATLLHHQLQPLMACGKA